VSYQALLEPCVLRWRERQFAQGLLVTAIRDANGPIVFAKRLWQCNSPKEPLCGSYPSRPGSIQIVAK